MNVTDRRQTDHATEKCIGIGWLGGSVVRALARDRKVASSTPGQSTNNSGQVVHTRVPLSPSSIIWYRPKGGDALRLGR